jgi:uncharacterized protein (DUF58 family)
MISAEIRKKIRQIEIRTLRLVSDQLAGAYHSAFKGQGMDFEDVRPYEAGDDVRRMHWNISARVGEPHIKRFREEREMTVMLLADVSGSGDFGSTGVSRKEFAAELASVLAFSAMMNQDHVGLMLFSDRVERYVPPAKGDTHVLRLIRDILSFEPERHGTNISEALHELQGLIHRKALVFLMSDFLDPEYMARLPVVARQHDLVALHLIDPRELELPDAGFVTLEDCETGELLSVDTSDKKLRERYATAAQERLERTRKEIRKSGVDLLEMRIDQPYLPALKKFFATRRARL